MKIELNGPEDVMDAAMIVTAIEKVQWDDTNDGERAERMKRTWRRLALAEQDRMQAHLGQRSRL